MRSSARFGGAGCSAVICSHPIHGKKGWAVALNTTQRNKLGEKKKNETAGERIPPLPTLRALTFSGFVSSPPVRAPRDPPPSSPLPRTLFLETPGGGKEEEEAK